MFSMMKRWLTLATLLLVTSGTFAVPQNVDTTERWASSLAQAAALVQQMTIYEWENLTIGYVSETNGCSGNSGGAPRVGFPGLCLNDAGQGVRGTDFVNSYASGISAGASWNTALANIRGQYLGAEFKRKGVDVALGPVVGPLGRVALGGRNWESFGADPYLQGRMAAMTITGMQESVIASVKHLVAYEQETNRQPSGDVKSVSANVDDSEMHELYLWPFQDAVHAGAACTMCSYNRINNTYACENDASLNGLLKSELNFPGFVLSDWGGQHSGVPSAIAGLDMAMPTSVYWKNMLAYDILAGLVPPQRVQNMAERIVAAWYYIGGLNATNFHRGAGMPKDLLAPHRVVDGRDPAAKAALLQSAMEGHVLVKNVKGALPLSKPKMLSLFGYDTHVPPTNNPDTSAISPWLYGLQSLNATVQQIVGVLTGNAADNVESAILGTMIVGGGSGSNSASYFSDPYSAIEARAYDDGTALLWDFQSTSPSVNPASTACLVFINEFATEGTDRAGLADPASDTLVRNVAAKCSNTIVIIHNAGIQLVEEWFNDPNVTAVMFAHLPGQDSGRALVHLLYGDVSPSGRLPYTVAKTAFDYGPLLFPSKPSSANDTSPQSNSSDPKAIDYRYFVAHNIEPRYHFGYGLTYSTFAYSSLSVAWIGTEYQLDAPPAPDVRIPGGTASLFDAIASVTFTLQNTGSYVAAEVPQLYVRRPGKTVQVLRGFTKENLQPQERKQITLTLRRKDLSVWDVKMQQWMLRHGRYEMLLGKSVGDVQLRATLTK